MNRTIARLILTILLASAKLATAQEGGTYALGGTVVNSRTGEPVKRALVTLVHFNAPEPIKAGSDGKLPMRKPPVTTTTFTDAAGTFRFSALATGRYLASAEKPGFTLPEGVTENPGQINLTNSMEGIHLTLSPLGVIEGKIVDQDGQPLRAVTVLARSVRIIDGLKQANADRTAITDDRGQYRVWNLSPGGYFIQASGRSGGTNLYAGDTAPQYIADQTFTPRYFGGSKNLESATPVLIEAGAEVSADVAVTLEAAYKIRGSLANFVPRRTVSFELISDNEAVSASRVSVNGDTGRFEVLFVPAGSYTLRATQGETVAEVAVNVSGRDLDGIVAQLMPGVDIKVATRFAVTPEAPPTANDAFGSLRNGFCSVQLHPAAGKSYTLQGNLGGAIPGLGPPSVLPGAYRTSIQCSGGYVTSAMYGSQDLLVNPTLTVQPGAAPSTIEIAGQQGGGSIVGTLSYHSTEKTPSAGVLLVPQYSASTGPEMTAAFEPGQPGSLEFDFENLAPGRYLAYAFSNFTDVEYRNPEFLRTLTGGVSVDVEAGAEKKIAIEGVVR